MFGRIVGLLVLAVFVGAGLFWNIQQQPRSADFEKPPAAEQVIVSTNRAMPQPNPAGQPVRGGVRARNASDQKLVTARPQTFAPKKGVTAVGGSDIDDLLSRFMPEATDAERAIWREQFDGLEAHEVEFILQQRVPLPRSLMGDIDDGHSGDAKSSVEFMPGPVNDSLLPPIPEPTVATDTNLFQQRLRAAVSDNVRHARQIGFCRWLLEIDPVNATEDYRIDFTVGEILETGEPLDLAATSGGLFKVTVDDKAYFTRNGCFRFDAGRIVTSYAIDGQPGVLLEGLPRTISDIKVAENGEVYCVTADDEKQFGKIATYMFLNRTLLSRTPSTPSVFIASAASGEPIEVAAPKIQQRALMQSNSAPNVPYEREFAIERERELKPF